MLSQAVQPLLAMGACIFLLPINQLGLLAAVLLVCGRASIRHEMC